MLSFIRSLPFVGIALLFAWGAHSFIVGNLNKTIEQQQRQIDVIILETLVVSFFYIQYELPESKTYCTQP